MLVLSRRRHAPTMPYQSTPRQAPSRVASSADIDTAVQAARTCFDTVWHKVSAAERGRLDDSRLRRGGHRLDGLWDLSSGC